MAQALEIVRVRLGSYHPTTQTIQAGLSATRQRLVSAADQSSDNPVAGFAPMLLAIARIALGNEAQRPQVEQALAQFEQNGWMLRAPVAQIWGGKRDRNALVKGLHAQDKLLIDRVLDLIGELESGEQNRPY